MNFLTLEDSILLRILHKLLSNPISKIQKLQFYLYAKLIFVEVITYCWLNGVESKQRIYVWSGTGIEPRISSLPLDKSNMRNNRKT